MTPPLTEGVHPEDLLPRMSSARPPAAYAWAPGSHKCGRRPAAVLASKTPDRRCYLPRFPLLFRPLQLRPPLYRGRGLRRLAHRLLTAHVWLISGLSTPSAPALCVSLLRSGSVLRGLRAQPGLQGGPVPSCLLRVVCLQWSILLCRPSLRAGRPALPHPSSVLFLPLQFSRLRQTDPLDTFLLCGPRSWSRRCLLYTSPSPRD